MLTCVTPLKLVTPPIVDKILLISAVGPTINEVPVSATAWQPFEQPVVTLLTLTLKQNYNKYVSLIKKCVHHLFITKLFLFNHQIFNFESDDNSILSLCTTLFLSIIDYKNY